MQTAGKVKSYNQSTSTDCFGIRGPQTEDHIWPTSKDGALDRDNVQFLSKEGNRQKDDNTKGEINGVRFAVKEAGKTQNGKTIGVMYIKISNEWYEVY